ncbi:hypothetical protein ACOMHN_047963 [Nucella lapillus]
MTHRARPEANKECCMTHRARPEANKECCMTHRARPEANKECCMTHRARPEANKECCMTHRARPDANKECCMTYRARPEANKECCMTHRARPEANKECCMTYRARPEANKECCMTHRARPEANKECCMTHRARPEANKECCMTHRARPEANKECCMTHRARPEANKECCMTHRARPEANKECCMTYRARPEANKECCRPEANKECCRPEANKECYRGQSRPEDLDPGSRPESAMVLGMQDSNRTVISVQGPQESGDRAHSPHTANGQTQQSADNLPLVSFHRQDGGDLAAASVHRQESSPPEAALAGKARSFPDRNGSVTRNGLTDGDEARRDQSLLEKADTCATEHKSSTVNDECSDEHGGAAESSANARRVSRKTGVYVLPSPPVVREQGGEQVCTFTDDTQVKGNPQDESSTTPDVKIVVTPDIDMTTEADSGVDTEAGTPSSLSRSSPTFAPIQPGLQEIEEESFSANNNDEEGGDNDEDDDKDQSSRILNQLHPLYEKNPGALRSARKISQDASVPPVYKQVPHLTGATRRISQHKRKVSVESDSNNSGGNTASNLVSSRKSSLVLIDQIPQIIQDSLQYYLQVPDSHLAAEVERDDLAGNTPARPQRVSVFSVNNSSRRSSNVSDVSFWDPQELLPHADHYHLAMDHHGNFRPRPTMYQLREEPVS